MGLFAGWFVSYYYYLIMFNVHIEPLGYGRLIISTRLCSPVAFFRSTFLALRPLKPGLSGCRRVIQLCRYLDSYRDDRDSPPSHNSNAKVDTNILHLVIYIFFPLKNIYLDAQICKIEVAEMHSHPGNYSIIGWL